jgi:hypothetical protein
MSSKAGMHQRTDGKLLAVNQLDEEDTLIIGPAKDDLGGLDIDPHEIPPPPDRQLFYFNRVPPTAAVDTDFNHLYHSDTGGTVSMFITTANVLTPIYTLFMSTSTDGSFAIAHTARVAVAAISSGNKRWAAEVVCRASAFTGNSNIYIGMKNVVTEDAPFHGYYFHANPTVNGGRWRLVRRTSGADAQVIDTGIAVSTATYLRFRLEAFGTDITGYMNETPIGTLNGVIQNNMWYMINCHRVSAGNSGLQATHMVIETPRS